MLICCGTTNDYLSSHIGIYSPCRRLVLFLLFFFFSSRRRHTRSDRDWSSDVCSSDLLRDACRPSPRDHGEGRHASRRFVPSRCSRSRFDGGGSPDMANGGRSSTDHRDRERGGEGKRGELGGGRII